MTKTVTLRQCTRRRVDPSRCLRSPPRRPRRADVAMAAAPPMRVRNVTVCPERVGPVGATYGGSPRNRTTERKHHAKGSSGTRRSAGTRRNLRRTCGRRPAETRKHTVCPGPERQPPPGIQGRGLQQQVSSPPVLWSRELSLLRAPALPVGRTNDDVHYSEPLPRAAPPSSARAAPSPWSPRV